MKAAGVVLLVLTQVGVGTLSPILLRKVIDVALPRHHTAFLLELCAGMFGCTAVGLMGSVYQSILVNDIGQGMVDDLRVTVYGRLQRMPLTFFTEEPVGEIETRLVSDIGGISSYAAATLQATLSSVAQLVAALVVMYIFSWILGTISLVLGIALSVLNERTGRRRRVLALATQERTADLMEAVAEDLSLPGVLLGRTLQSHVRQRTRFAGLSHQIAALNRRQRSQGSGSRFLIGAAFGGLTPILFILAGTATTGLSIGTVIVLVTLQARLTAPIQQLISLGATAPATTAMLERTFQYVDLDTDFDLDRNHVVDPGERPVLSTDQLCYRYPGQEEPAVRGVSLVVEPATLTVIVGSTGSGKSTLALLLSGQLKPTTGGIELGETPIPPEDLWNYVTLVPQETALYNTSLRENLLCASPASTDAELRKAIERVDLAELVDSLPEGLYNDVGEHGFSLSGGERQRVGLARALLNPSTILVADEPTSAVDNATAEQLATLLLEESRRRSVVLVTHRLPQLPDDARVVVMDHGKIIERGRPSELLAEQGRFAELVEMQNVTGGA